MRNKIRRRKPQHATSTIATAPQADTHGKEFSKIEPTHIHIVVVRLDEIEQLVLTEGALLRVPRAVPHSFFFFELKISRGIDYPDVNGHATPGGRVLFA